MVKQIYKILFFLLILGTTLFIMGSFGFIFGLVVMTIPCEYQIHCFLFNVLQMLGVIILAISVISTICVAGKSFDAEEDYY